MSKATGVVLILSGFAVATYMLPEGDPGAPEIAVSRTDVAKSSVVEVQPSAVAETTVPPWIIYEFDSGADVACLSGFKRLCESRCLFLVLSQAVVVPESECNFELFHPGSSDQG